jgi:AraC family transcriptional activator of mtrCDE
MDLRCLFGRGFVASNEAVGPWRAPFHIVLRGECELWLPQSGNRVLLQPGTLAILPRGAEHVLQTHEQKQRAFETKTIRGAVVDLKSNVVSTSGVEVEMFCGEFEFGGRRRSTLLDALPELVVVQFGQHAEFCWIDSLIRLMAHEIEHQHVGSAAIVAELCSALFILGLRAHLESASDLAGVLGLMRSTRLTPALNAMLDQPEMNWTVASLAHLCNLSRTTFAREFSRYGGETPLSLLTTLRMEKASALLLRGIQGAASIGEAVGYFSEAAFNRAFNRYAGMTPGRFRRMHRA